MNPGEDHDALCKAILEERACVQAYTTAWRGSAAVAVPDRKSVGDALHSEVSQEVYPWPRVDMQPVPRYEEGRFVKSFPLQFPMGVGDLYRLAR